MSIKFEHASSLLGVVHNFSGLLWDQAWEEHCLTVSRSKLLSRPGHWSAVSFYRDSVPLTLMLQLAAGTACVVEMDLADSDQRIGNTSYKIVNICSAVTKTKLSYPL